MSASPAPDGALGAGVVPVILSGGSGSRLWPVSRESFPKQYWPLMSDDTLIQETVKRAAGTGLCRAAAGVQP